MIVSVDEHTFEDQELEQMRFLLLSWFDHAQRDLPWRRTQDPYAIWVSEIMLQQTQVATVHDYYIRWMQRFPDVKSVADASLDDVLLQWSGLGYYRRARFLHKAARHVMEECAGIIPKNAKGLLALPGIGRYTAGAIASIAYNEPAPIVDGNVERILARLRAIDGDPKAAENQKHFWRLANLLVDKARPGDLNQSMMELGATVCTPKKPTCLLCPVRGMCYAHTKGDPLLYPAKVVRKPPVKVRVASVVACAHDKDGARLTLMCKRSAKEGLFAGLFEVPNVSAPGSILDDDLHHMLRSHWQHMFEDATEVLLPATALCSGKVVHRLSHRIMEIDVFYLMLGHTPSFAVIESGLAPFWARDEEIETFGMASVVRKILAHTLWNTPHVTDA